MDIITIFVLTETVLQHGKPQTKNVGVTTDLAEAEIHAEQTPVRVVGQFGYTEFGFQAFSLPTELFRMGAETTIFLEEIRRFKEAVRPIQQFIADSNIADLNTGSENG